MVTYTIAGGCFWCIDAVMRRLKGVHTSLCGYSGGDKNDADYYAVATGRTAHAEAVQITFDESIIPSDVILDIFFLVHDPTTLNQQGADIGPQYRSAMFYGDAHQKKAFEAALLRAQSVWNAPIVTDISPLDTFYVAEAEHQDYFNNNPGNGYCSVVIAPKITKARTKYTTWFKEDTE